MTGEQPAPTDCDVVVVGGGPAGGTAAIFTARYGLETTVFDRGPGALPRCAFLANYPGFPAGIDVSTFQALLADHVKTAGATRIEETVELVERAPTGDGNPPAGDDAYSPGSVDEHSPDGEATHKGFLVETAAGRRVRTRYVVAAAWYDGSYLAGLDDDGEMFAPREHHGEIEERFDREYADDDGRTPLDGLYVASPADARSEQAVVAAGNGAHVARSLLADHRRDRGYRGDVAPHYDWRRRESEFTGEWGDRDRWREWYVNATDRPEDRSDERYEALREAHIDAAFETRMSDDDAADRAAAGLDRFVSVVGHERVLDAVADDAIREYVDAEPTEVSD